MSANNLSIVYVSRVIGRGIKALNADYLVFNTDILAVCAGIDLNGIAFKCRVDGRLNTCVGFSAVK